MSLQEGKCLWAAYLQRGWDGAGSQGIFRQEARGKGNDMHFLALGTGTPLLQKTRLKDPAGICRTWETVSNLKKTKPDCIPRQAITAGNVLPVPRDAAGRGIKAP